MDHEQIARIKDDFEKLILDLKEKNRTVPVIVEGDKDILALNFFEFPGEVIKLNQGKPLFNLVEDWSKVYKEMIILTDWDRKGGRLARILSEAFDANIMKYDLEFRKQLAYLCKKDIKDVEALPRFIDNLEVRLASRTRDPAWDDTES